MPDRGIAVTDTGKAAVWSPPMGLDIALHPAGVAWDAARTHVALGELVLQRLGDTGGAVIRDSWSRHMYWLVAVGSADSWRLPDVCVLGAACYVAVPPPHRTDGPGPHWAVPPGGGRELTDAGALRGALAYALGARATS